VIAGHARVLYGLVMFIIFEHLATRYTVACSDEFPDLVLVCMR
jgi:hypothetical protein